VHNPSSLNIRRQLA